MRVLIQFKQNCRSLRHKIILYTDGQTDTQDTCIPVYVKKQSEENCKFTTEHDSITILPSVLVVKAALLICKNFTGLKSIS